MTQPRSTMHLFSQKQKQVYIHAFEKERSRLKERQLSTRKSPSHPKVFPHQLHASTSRIVRDCLRSKVGRAVICICFALMLYSFLWSHVWISFLLDCFWRSGYLTAQLASPDIPLLLSFVWHAKHLFYSYLHRTIHSLAGVVMAYCISPLLALLFGVALALSQLMDSLRTPRPAIVPPNIVYGITWVWWIEKLHLRNVNQLIRKYLVR